MMSKLVMSKLAVCCGLKTSWDGIPVYNKSNNDAHGAFPIILRPVRLWPKVAQSQVSCVVNQLEL